MSDENIGRHPLESVLGYRFADTRLLDRALTHASLVESRLASNERMEFLGDAILGLVVCECIYRKYPSLLEGEMTKIKSLAVSRQMCARIAMQMGLTDHLQLGKGMQAENGELPASLAAAVLESIIAAIYLDSGFARVVAFILPIVEPLIDEAAQSGHQQNFKSVLQQHAQRAGLGTPIYRVLDEKGPDHAKCFKICVEIGATRYESSWAQSKKRAEQMAALNALKELGVIFADPSGGLRMTEGK